MVYVFAANIDALPDPISCPGLLDGLPKKRREKILRYKRMEGRRQSLGAGLLLQNVLAQYGLSEEQTSEGAHGKPMFCGSEEQNGNAKGLIQFNLSHSGSLVVCAVSSDLVGCDVEKIDSSHTSVASHFFGTWENQYLSFFEGEDRAEQFCRLWTMRESYIKMTGEGMRLDLRKFEVRSEGALHESDRLDSGVSSFSIYREGSKENCSIKEYGAEGYCISVCAREKQFAEQIQWESFDR